MTRWILAIALAALVASLAYARASGAGHRGRIALLGLLRFAAVALVAAMVFGAPTAPPAPSVPLLALDASASWLRAGGDDSATVRALQAGWNRVAASAAAGGGDVLLFGDSLRELSRADLGRYLPRDAASRVRGAVDRAAALGRPLVIVTDGEIDDADAVAEAPPGSRIVRVSADSTRAPRRDAALADLTVPTAGTAGDSIRVQLLVTAGAGGSVDGSVEFRLDGEAVARVAVPALGAFATTRIAQALPLPRGAKVVMLKAVLAVAGDVEPRNDTLAAAIEVMDRPSVVFVSTMPDLDVREALVLLRGSMSLPTRAYLQIAQGSWREEGTLARISEEEVKVRAANAGLLIVHGDTMWASTLNRGVRRGSRALWSPAPPVAQARAGENPRASEWYVTGAPLSPLTPALSGIPWDSLPPITLAGLPRGAVTVLEAKLGRQGAAVPAIVLRDDGGQRTIVISGSGYAGWALRGGRAAEAFSAVWGSIFDWLVVGRGDVRAARPASAFFRTGTPVRWRRGGPDSLVTAILIPRALPGAMAPPVPDTVRIRFAGGDMESTTATREPGVYDVQSVGGASVLVVNASPEWVPRPATVAEGELSRGVTSTDAPRLADSWWPFVAVLLLLSAEWIARRSAGLR